MVHLVDVVEHVVILVSGTSQYFVALFPETRFVLFFILRKTTLKCFPLYHLNYKRGAEITFYVSYIHSRTIYGVPIERAWHDNSNHTKYSISPKIDLRVFRNNVKNQCVSMRTIFPKAFQFLILNFWDTCTFINTWLNAVQFINYLGNALILYL